MTEESHASQKHANSQEHKHELCECKEGRCSKFMKFLKIFDIYALPINFTVDNDNERISNPFGGLMSIIFILLSIVFIGNETIEMYHFERSSFFISSYRNEAT